MQKITSGFYLAGNFIYKKPLLFFFLLAVLAYWPISFFLFSVQYDMIDVVLPWRYFAGECLQNNSVPLWNPYQQCGYPIHADLQYSLWYPEVYILGFIFGYTNLTLHILYIIYIALAGFGMYKLAKELTINHHYALLAGGAFMLCGIFVGHAQSLVSILGATWLPWVIAYYIRTINSDFRFSNVLKLVLFTFLMLSGGYQAVSFMLLYLLIAFFLYKTITHILKHNYKQLIQLLLSNVLFALLLFMLCFGMLISIFYVFPLIERLSGLSYEFSNIYAFTPQSFISFLFPFAAITNNEFFGTDISMTNGFIGVIIIMAGTIGVFRKKSGFMTILILFGGAFFLASLGKYTPVQKLLFSYVPFLNLFKFPCFYRYFAILAFIVSAGYFFTHHIEKDKLYRNKTFLSLLGITLFIYLTAVIISITKISFQDFTYLIHQKHIIDRFRQATIYENIAIQGIIQFTILSVFLFLILYKRHLNKWIIFIFAFVELIIAVQLNLPVTGYGTAKPFEIRQKINRFPEGFPVPDHIELEKNSDANNASGVLWRNLGNFNKQVSADAFTSFLFSGWMDLMDSFPSFRDSIMNNAMVYLSDDIRSLDEIGGDRYSKKTIYLPDSIWSRYSNQSYTNNKGDTVFITSFQPDKIICKTSSKNPQWLNLIQNDYMGWQAFIDGEKADHYTSNLSLISLPVPAGDHEVIFLFQLNIVRKAYILSVVAFLLLVLLIYYYRLKESEKSVLIRMLLTLFISGLLIALYVAENDQRKRRDLKAQLVNEKIFTQIQTELPDEAFKILTWDNLNARRNRDTLKNYYCSQNIRINHVVELSKILSDEENSYLYYDRRNTLENPVVLGMLKYLYPEYNNLLSDRNFTQAYFSKNRMEKNKDSDLFALTDSKVNWGINAEMDSSRFHSVPVSYYIGSDCMYGLSLTLSGKDFIKKKNRILSFNGRIYWENPDRSYLVIHIIRNKHAILYDAMDLMAYETLRKNWYVFSQAIWLSDYIRDDDEIKVYIWNPGKASFWIDEAQVEIF